MAFNVKKHDKVYDRALEEIQENVFDNVKALENEVAVIVAQGLPPEQAFGTGNVPRSTAFEQSSP